MSTHRRDDRARARCSAHITGGHVETIDAGPRSFQPMNVNFGLFPPLASSPCRGPDGERLSGAAKTLARKRALTARALADLDQWIADGGRRRRPRRSNLCRTVSPC